MQMTAYAHRVELPIPFDVAVEAAVHELNEQGFGVLTWIDMKNKLKEGLGVDFRRYVIMGTCNPGLAHRALLAEPEVGILLPCNVIVYETESGGSVVAAMAPKAAMDIVGNNAELEKVATEADERIRKAMDALEGRTA